MAEIEGLVRALREGGDAAKADAAWELGGKPYNQLCLIAEAGGIAPLVQLLRDGSAGAKRSAVWALANLARNNAANKVAITEAGGIPPLVELLRDGSADAKLEAAAALRHLALNNAANAVAIAVTVGGLEALVELARGGHVTVDSQRLVRNAGIAAKRKSALVVAALLRDCVPEFKSAPGDIKAAIASFL